MKEAYRVQNERFLFDTFTVSYHSQTPSGKSLLHKTAHKNAPVSNAYLQTIINNLFDKNALSSYNELEQF